MRITKGEIYLANGAWSIIILICMSEFLSIEYCNLIYCEQYSIRNSVCAIMWAHLYWWTNSQQLLHVQSWTWSYIMAKWQQMDWSTKAKLNISVKRAISLMGVPLVLVREMEAGPLQFRPAWVSSCNLSSVNCVKNSHLLKHSSRLWRIK